MRSPAKCAVWVLLFLLTGCSHLPFHRSAPTQAQALAPLPPPPQPLDVVSVELPPSEIVIPAKRIYNMREPAVPIKSPAKHRRPSKTPEEAAANSDAATNAASEVSAIGQLSSGDPGGSREQTEGSIAEIERGVNGINRNLDDTEKKTADQIREFLKEAKVALISGDVEGAHTLAAKAKALLDELTK